MTPTHLSDLDFRIAVAERQLHPTFLCVNGEYLTLDQAKRLRDEYAAKRQSDSCVDEPNEQPPEAV